MSTSPGEGHFDFAYPLQEFVWSPKYANLEDFFRHEVPANNHVLYMGATRFGWSGMRHRFTYSLQEVRPHLPQHQAVQ